MTAAAGGTLLPLMIKSCETTGQTKQRDGVSRTAQTGGASQHRLQTDRVQNTIVCST